MKRKIDWLNRFLEFFVVLVGILIAFQLNTCSDNRSKANLIENHLFQIEIECIENKKRIESSISQIDKQISNCDSLLSLIKLANNPELVRNQSVTLLDLRNVVLISNAYKVLIESGDIRYMNDYDTKRIIISLYEGFKEVDQINGSTQYLYDNHFYPYIKKNFDLANWRGVSSISASKEKLYYSLEFANTISTYRYLLIEKKRICKKIGTEFNEYIKA